MTGAAPDLRVTGVSPEAVVFDCDGVLVDSEPLSNAIFAQVITEEGLLTTFEDSVRLYLGRSNAESAAQIEAALGRPLRTDLIGEYERRAAAAFCKELTAVPGVRELLDELAAAGTPRCVASSGTPEEIALRLEITRLGHYFGDHVYSASMVPRGKPEPELFLHAAAQLGVDPAQCVLIEDSRYGVRGGKAAGMTVIGMAALVSAEDLRAAGADHVVDEMPQVRKLLGL
ncbi:MAG: HAD-IA family hydrolase [Micromonosporaceae bacterium]|nr:HAD-IA family hydrolase [Micromonosporaceae bacterium]